MWDGDVEFLFSCSTEYLTPEINLNTYLHTATYYSLLNRTVSIFSKIKLELY